MSQRRHKGLVVVVAVLAMSFFGVGSRAQSIPKELQKLDSLAKAATFEDIDLALSLAYELHEKSQTADDPVSQFLGLNRLGSIYYYLGQGDSALHYYRQYLLAAKASASKPHIASGHNNIGVTLMEAGQLSAALGHYRIALELRIELNDTLLLPSIYGNIGFCMETLNRDGEAMKNYYLALEQAEKNQDKLQMATHLSNIGGHHVDKGNPSLAIPFLRRAIQYGSEMNDQYGLAGGYVNLGDAFAAGSDQDSAHYYYRRALRGFQTIKALDGVSFSYGRLGALVGKQDYGRGLELLDSAIQLSASIGNDPFLWELQLMLGEIHKIHGKYLAGIEALQPSVRLSKQVESDRDLQQLYAMYGELHSLMGQMDSAYHYLSLSVAVADSIEMLRQAEVALDVENQYNARQRQDSIQRLEANNAKLQAEGEQKEAEIERGERQVLWLILVIALASVVLVLLWISYRRKRITALLLEERNKAIMEQKEIIEQSLQEKDFLMRELHHRIKNNLQIISSLLKLQSHYIKDEVALRTIKDSRDRVDSIALMHRKLYAGSQLNSVDLQMFFKDLRDNLNSSHGLDQRQISIEVDSPNIELGIDKATPIGLIVQELVTNAVKHAFPEAKSGTIKLMVHASEAQTLDIMVSDDGVGMAAEEQPEASFGMRLVQLLVDKLNGSIEVDSKSGTLVKLTFPTQHAA